MARKQFFFSKAPQNIKELSDLGFTKTNLVFSTSEALKKLKQIKFEDTIIIISLNLYSQFIKDFTKNITHIYTIPKESIF